MIMMMVVVVLVVIMVMVVVTFLFYDSEQIKESGSVISIHDVLAPWNILSKAKRLY